MHFLYILNLKILYIEFLENPIISRCDFNPNSPSFILKLLLTVFEAEPGAWQIALIHDPTTIWKHP